MSLKRIYILEPHESVLVSEYDQAMLDLRTHVQGDSRCEIVQNIEHADIVILHERWETRFLGYRDEVVHALGEIVDPNKVFVINTDDLARGFLPGIYASLNRRNFVAGYHVSGPYPYDINTHVLANLHEMDVEQRLLFSFRGTTNSSPLRLKMLRVLANHPRGSVIAVNTAFRQHDEAQKQAYVDDIRRSAFVLCPRGWSPNTYRLFETMELGRCPVIISDDWIPVDGVDWDGCSIRWSETQLHALPDYLATQEHRAQELGQRARAVWEQYFAPHVRAQFYLDRLLELQAVRADGPQLPEWWWSRDFIRRNEWLFWQKVYGRLQRLLGRLRGQSQP